MINFNIFLMYISVLFLFTMYEITFVSIVSWPLVYCIFLKASVKSLLVNETQLNSHNDSIIIESWLYIKISIFAFKLTYNFNRIKIPGAN